MTRNKITENININLGKIDGMNMDVFLDSSFLLMNNATGVWLHINCDTDCRNFLLGCNKKELCMQHPTFNITVLQWLLWYTGSGVRAFAQHKNGGYTRKEWAFHKIGLIKKYLDSSLWRALVHTHAGFDKKCTTFHFFARNCYTIDCHQLNTINKWLDEADGRTQYQYDTDEYGLKPSEYVALHKNRQNKFRKHIKNKVDPLVDKYHNIEVNLKALWDIGKNALGTNATDYWEWLKEVAANGNNVTYKLPQSFRTGVLESARARIASHVYHDSLFNDRLSEIEKEEENKGRGLSQTTNHLWIIRTYQVLLRNTPEGLLLQQCLKSKKIEK